MTTYDVSLLEGDGIGPELSECVYSILVNIHDKSSNLKFNISRVEAGDNAKLKYNKPLPDETFNEIKNSQA
jgi:3-isopropylmalate dehydrogenase